MDNTTDKAIATTADGGARSDDQGRPPEPEIPDLTALSSMGADALRAVDRQLHELWVADVEAEGATDADNETTSAGKVARAHLAVLERMAEVDVEHPAPEDGLDAATLTLDPEVYGDIAHGDPDDDEIVHEEKADDEPLPSNVVDKVPGKLPHAGKAMIDIFSGIGALSLGLERAGFKAVAAIESERMQAHTYALNHPDATVLLGDCHDFDPKVVARAVGKVALITGGVPCEPFSGARVVGSGKATDPRKSLINYALDLVEACKPSAFIFENVTRALASPSWKRAFKRAEALGYKVAHWKLLASEHGAPQARRRGFFVGMRGDLPEPPEPKPGKPTTVREALANLKPERLHNPDEYKLGPKAARAAAAVSPGESLNRAPNYKHFNMIRLHPDRPAPTVMAGHINVHFNGKRHLTARESAVLQGIPNSYKFPESASPRRVCEMVGDCVPVQLAQAVGKAILSASVFKADEASNMDDTLKVQWTGAYVNDLPDSAFLLIEAGGKKDGGGKTVPRSLRHFPVRDGKGDLDLPHLRNAIARVPQSEVAGLDADAKAKLQDKAREMLAEETRRQEQANKANDSVLVKVRLDAPLSPIAKAAVEATIARVMGVPVAVVYEEPELLQARITKAEERAGDEHYIEGVVLEPTDLEGGWDPDAQREVYSADDVRKAMLGWAEAGMNMKIQHTAPIPDGAVKVLETWQVRAPFQSGDQAIKVGTWMLSLRVVDSTLWSAIRSGAVTGFSIGGTARRMGV